MLLELGFSLTANPSVVFNKQTISIVEHYINYQPKVQEKQIEEK